MTTYRATPSPIPLSAALVSLPAPEEAAFGRLQADIRLRHVQIERLTDDIAPLLTALEKFEWTYKGRLGPLQQELATLRDQTARIEQRTMRIHARLVADPDGILGDLFTRDELNDIGEMFGIDIPESWFGPEEAAQRAEDERAWHFFEGTAYNPDEEEDILRRIARGRTRRLSNDDRSAMRTLYLRLARECHPDLARDDKDRQLRQELMLRINDAWHAQDLHALRSLEQDRATALGWRTLTNWIERLRWARAEIARLDTQVIALTERLATLRTSETYPLWFNPALGDSVITQRATALRIDIATAHHRLDEAKVSFRQALQHYAAAVA